MLLVQTWELKQWEHDISWWSKKKEKKQTSNVHNMGFFLPFYANLLCLHLSLKENVTICCLMWFGSHAGRSSKQHNEIIWLHFSFPSLLWANMHSSFSPAAMTTPASLFFFFRSRCPTCRIVGQEGPFFFFFSFLCNERHISRGHRPLGNQCGGCCSGRPASWLCLIVAELDGVAKWEGVRGRCRDVFCECVCFFILSRGSHNYCQAWRKRILACTFLGAHSLR